MSDERWTSRTRSQTSPSGSPVENHDEMAGYYDDVLAVIEDPELVLQGHRGSLIAAHGCGRDRYLMVIYKELSADDGFVITAYFARKPDRSRVTWKRQ